jgi:hypothetical protein
MVSMLPNQRLDQPNIVELYYLLLQYQQHKPANIIVNLEKKSTMMIETIYFWPNSFFSFYNFSQMMSQQMNQFRTDRFVFKRHL